MIGLPAIVGRQIVYADQAIVRLEARRLEVATSVCALRRSSISEGSVIRFTRIATPPCLRASWRVSAGSVSSPGVARKPFLLVGICDGRPSIAHSAVFFGGGWLGVRSWFGWRGGGPGWGCGRGSGDVAGGWLGVRSWFGWRGTEDPGHSKTTRTFKNRQDLLKPPGPSKTARTVHRTLMMMN